MSGIEVVRTVKTTSCCHTVTVNRWNGDYRPLRVHACTLSPRCHQGEEQWLLQIHFVVQHTTHMIWSKFCPSILTNDTGCVCIGISPGISLWFVWVCICVLHCIHMYSCTQNCCLCRSTLDGYFACSLMTSRSSAVPTTTQFSSGTFWIQNQAQISSVNTKWKWKSKCLLTVPLHESLCQIKSTPYESTCPFACMEFRLSVATSLVPFCLVISCPVSMYYCCTEDDQGRRCVWLASCGRRGHVHNKCMLLITNLAHGLRLAPIVIGVYWPAYRCNVHVYVYMG